MASPRAGLRERSWGNFDLVPGPAWDWEYSPRPGLGEMWGGKIRGGKMVGKIDLTGKTCKVGDWG